MLKPRPAMLTSPHQGPSAGESARSILSPCALGVGERYGGRRISTWTLHASAIRRGRRWTPPTCCFEKTRWLAALHDREAAQREQACLLLVTTQSRQGGRLYPRSRGAWTRLWDGC